MERGQGGACGQARWRALIWDVLPVVRLMGTSVIYHVCGELSEANIHLQTERL